MLDRLIQLSLRYRAIVLACCLGIMAVGLFTLWNLPVEVLPDLTKPTVIVLTEAPGLAPEEVEIQITQSIETALMGIPGLTRLRSNSDVSLSLVYAEFDWGSDVARNRLQVQERLRLVRDQLPVGVEPFLTPAASLMGEILLVGVRSTIPKGQDGYMPPADVRSLADWVIKRRLQNIPGIAEVLNMGGGVKQIEIQPDPRRMMALGVDMQALELAATKAVNSTTGGFMDSGSTEVMIRNLAMTTDLDAIGKTVVRKLPDRIVTLAEVADVRWGIEPMRGDATVSLAPEKHPTYGVIMSVTKAPGFDTRKLTAQVNSALRDLKLSLPTGVETIVLFEQKQFIDHAIGNLQRAIIEAAVMVTLVLFVFLLNFRTTLITLLAIPVSFGITMIVFRWFGVSVNSMTLGGLAVAIGMVVDDAIVDVENVLRRLRENARFALPLPQKKVIAAASSEVRSSIFYATTLIILVFVPLLGLTGIEGRLFAPIAMATIVSMLASFLVSLTLIPVLCSYWLNPTGCKEQHDSFVVRFLKKILSGTMLRLAFNHPLSVMVFVLAGFIGAFLIYRAMGKDFLPPFKEETALIAATSSPGTSLQEMNKISDVIEEQILAVPEVMKVGRRLGRAERGDHVVPVSTAEFDVDFMQGRNAGRSRKEVLDDIKSRIKTVPWVFAVVGGPLGDRIGHMMSGVSAPVVVKIYGPDLEQLRQIGSRIQSLAKSIPGFESVKLDQQSTIPQIRIEPDRTKANAYGIVPGALTEQLGALLGGKLLSEIRDGNRVVNLVVRLPLEFRNSPQKIAGIPIQTGENQYVPLSAISDVREAKGPNVIFRENGQRRFTVAIKPTVSDVGNLVEKLRGDVSAKIELPEGYFVTYEGEFRAQREATTRILLLSGLVLVAIVFLLNGYFRSILLTGIVLFNIPLALAGGIALTWVMVGNISVASLVGFIAVGGIAARNGIMMLSHYLHLMKHEGEGFTRSMVERGTQERMVPVLMTALAAGIALIPFVLAGEQPGKEILHPVAVVIVGGLLSSTILDFLVTPLIFFWFAKNSALRALERQAPAAG